MARLPRLALAGHTHLVLQSAHSGLPAAGRPLFADGVDRLAFRQALFTAAAEEGVGVLAYALHDAEVRLLLNPATAAGLSRLMQSLGRRYVRGYHRRHGGRGTLWDGRFRAAVVEPGPWRLAALRWVDGAAEVPLTAATPSADAASASGTASASVRTGAQMHGLIYTLIDTQTDTQANRQAGAPTDEPTPASTAAALSHPTTDAGATSSGFQRLGGHREPGLLDPPEWWSLGNTPFEREAAYRALLLEGLPAAQNRALRAGALGGWALGSAAFAEQVAQSLGRPARPRTRGRPRKSPENKGSDSNAGSSSNGNGSSSSSSNDSRR